MMLRVRCRAFDLFLFFLSHNEQVGGKTAFCEVEGIEMIFERIATMLCYRNRQSQRRYWTGFEKLMR
jgi:hypothetical protein